MVLLLPPWPSSPIEDEAKVLVMQLVLDIFSQFKPLDLPTARHGMRFGKLYRRFMGYARDGACWEKRSIEVGLLRSDRNLDEVLTARRDSWASLRYYGR